MRHGVWRQGEGLRLAVWAPRTERLAVRVDGADIALSAAPGGWWTAELPVLPSGTPYALAFPGDRLRPDPAARALVGDVHGPSAIFHPGEFRWTDQRWAGVRPEALVFYELHVGAFTEAGTLDAAADRLPELVELGVTCVELMPVQPFAGARNWGYDGVLLHAVHPAYGGPAALQRFVDRAHALGLGVCLDVVYNHLGPEGNYLGEFGPYTTARHRSPWGDGMNYDGPDAGPVRAYMVQAARSWVEDFHVDALRLDAVHAIVDDGPVHLVADIVRAVHEGSGGKAHVIAESDLNDRRVVDPPPAGWGCTAVWADDFHHVLHAMLTGERSAFYTDFGEPRELWSRRSSRASSTRDSRRASGADRTGPGPTACCPGSSSSACRTTIRSATGPPASDWRASCRPRHSSRWRRCCSSAPGSRCSSWARSTARPGRSSTSRATATPSSPGPCRRVAGTSSSPGPQRYRTRRTTPPSGAAVRRRRGTPVCERTTAGCWRFAGCTWTVSAWSGRGCAARVGPTLWSGRG